MKSPIHRFRVVDHGTSADVEQITHCAPGSEHHPDVQVERTALVALAPEVAERTAKELNAAFNLGREYATQR